MLKIERQWSKQPQFNSGLNKGSAFTNGLIFATHGRAGGFNLVDGRTPTAAGKSLHGVSPSGVGVDLGSTATDRYTWAIQAEAQQNITLLAVCSRRTTATLLPISTHSKTQSSTNCNYIELNASSNRPIAGTAAASSFTTIEGTSFGFIQLAQANVYAATFTAGGRSIFGNGVLLANSTVTRSPAAADEICIGSLYDDNLNAYTAVGNGVVTMAAVWRRALSNDEITYLSRNPWQLFAPRRIWVPVSAVGGGLPTLSSSTYKPGTLTSSGWTPRITAS